MNMDFNIISTETHTIHTHREWTGTTLSACPSRVNQCWICIEKDSWEFVKKGEEDNVQTDTLLCTRVWFIHSFSPFNPNGKALSLCITVILVLRACKKAFIIGNCTDSFQHDVDRIVRVFHLLLSPYPYLSIQLKVAKSILECNERYWKKKSIFFSTIRRSDYIPSIVNVCFL